MDLLLATAVAFLISSHFGVSFGIIVSQSYSSPLVWADFDLEKPQFGFKHGPVMARRKCAALCQELPGCQLFSIKNSGGYGFCKLGSHSDQKKPRKGATVYQIVKESTRNKADGMTYTRYTDQPVGFDDTRMVCVLKPGNLPIVYPSDVMYRAALSKLSVLDTVFVDMTKISNSSDQKFVTGWGVTVDASRKDYDTFQHWAPGEPKVIPAANRTAVVMSSLGWATVNADTFKPTATLCSNDSATFRLNILTGKYYRFNKDAALRPPDAKSKCQDLGGQLALTYGVNGVFPQDQYPYNADFYIVDGTDAYVEGVWEFWDGTKVFPSTYPERNNDTRQRWTFNYEPDGGTDQNFLYVASNSRWENTWWYSTKYYLCERQYP